MPFVFSLKWDQEEAAGAKAMKLAETGCQLLTEPLKDLVLVRDRFGKGTPADAYVLDSTDLLLQECKKLSANLHNQSIGEPCDDASNDLSLVRVKAMITELNTKRRTKSLHFVGFI